jgi:phosphatidylglycerophosphatase A
MALATGIYVGMLPKAPATWASLAAFLPWLLMKGLSFPMYLAVLLCTIIVGFFAAGSAEKILDQADAEPIVIDEIIGMLVTLTLVPAHPVAWILAFVLFRIFDTLKPFPISWIKNHLHGGIGIMLDDIVAGIYACISLHLIFNLYKQIIS